MRWNCPHCGVALAVSDDKLGSGWSFSRCYKCAGFSLVRRSDINLIKVDKPPAGEHIMLPEAAEVPMISNKAVENSKLDKRVETRGISVKGAPAKVPPPQKKPEPRLEELPKDLDMPDPLPQIPSRSRHFRLLPFAIAAAGIAAIASGAYLYVEGQELWKQTKASVIASTQETAIRPRTPTSAEVIAAPPLYMRAKAEVAADSPKEITDQLHQHAMAPSFKQDEPGEAQQNMAVETRTARVILRAGPGQSFPVVGVAQPQTRFRVSDWNDRWFKIIVDQQPLDNVPTESPRVAWVRNDLVQLVSSGNKNN